MELESRIDRLEEALGRLTEAQSRTEEAVRALAEAQGQTETRIGQLESVLARLAEAQVRTEARVGNLEAAMARLSEAQARTEARLEELAGAQTRLAMVVEALAQQVARLSDTIGFTLEDLAREITPAYLAEHYSIRELELERRFFVVDGQEVEVDFYGEGRRNGEVVAVVGDARSRIYGGDVERAVRQTRQLVPQLPGTAVTVLFGFVIHPSARDAARRLGAIFISSSGR